MRLKRQLFLALGTALLFAGSAFAASEIVDTIEQSFAVGGRPFIYIRNVDGKNRIVAGAGDQVHVRAVKEVLRADSKEEARRAAEEVEVRIEQVGDRIQMEAKYPNRWFSLGRGPRVLVHFEVTAPATSDVEAKSVDGPLEVQGLDGRIELSTVDGDLNGDGCGGRLDVRTVDGDILLKDVFGEVSAHTTDGSLSINGSPEMLEARSTDGRIEIRIDSDSGIGRNWTIRTTDGDIRIGIPEGFGADLDIETNDGRIHCDHPVTIQGSAKRNRLRGRLNDGGGLLEIRSSDGDITITKR